MSIKKEKNIFVQKTKQGTGGQVVLGLVLVFLSLSLTFLFAASSPVVQEMKNTRAFLNSQRSYFLAEAGIEDVVYRIKNGVDVAPTTNINLSGHNAEVILTDVQNGKNVLSQADVSGHIRKVEVSLIVGEGVAFNYGIQSGNGGFVMHNNSRVEGNIYVNGNIIGSSGAEVTGAAIAANSIALTSNQANVTPIPAPNAIVFGNHNNTQDVAQSFILTESGPITQVSLLLRKIVSNPNHNPPNITVRIVEDLNDAPSSYTITSQTLSASLVSQNFGWVEVVFSSNPFLDEGEKYWLVLDAGTNSSRYYEWAANNNYSAGEALIGRYNTSNGGTWSDTSPQGLDGYFEIFLGGLNAVIDTVQIGGDARAYEVKNSNIGGELLCTIGSGNNKACDTTGEPPSPQPFPISGANIESWKEQAQDGGIIGGNYTAPGSASSLGPIKITGDLTLNNNHVLTLTGIVWVEGRINVGNGAHVRVDPSYGHSGEILLSDGRINLENNVVFSGSGHSPSYVLLVTTSNCPDSGVCGGNNAIQVSNNVESVILNAQKGTIHFANNAGANAATADRIILSNNAVVVYESGLANPSFSQGPSGGFNIVSWKEVK